MDKTTAAKVHINPDNNWAMVGLSTRSIKHGDDWRNSVVHELLHVMFWKHMTGGNRLTVRNEENIVETLSCALARAKPSDLL
jgi:hypothetical protein